MTPLSKRKECIFGITMVAISTAFLISTYSYPDQSVAFPRFLIVLSCFFSLLLLLRALRLPSSGSVSSTNTLSRMGVPLKVFTSVAVYVGLVEVIGFYTASALFLVGSMLMYGTDRWSTRVLVTAGFLATIYIIFGLLIGVRFPAGWLF